MEGFVQISVRNFTYVGTHGLLLPGLCELALSGAVQGRLAVLVLQTPGQHPQAVVAHTGRDSEEVGVRGHPCQVLADSPRTCEDADIDHYGS